MALQISISNAIGARAVAGGGGIDPDAQAFITAASITDPTQQSAINQLVVDLKGYSIWTKMKALYPFVGGTSGQHAWNLKDTTQYKITWYGGVTHSSNGITGNGTNGYADTFLANNVMSQNDAHLSIYSRTNLASTVCDIGSWNGQFGSKIYSRSAGANFEATINTSGQLQQANSDSRGFYLVTRKSSTSVTGQKNSTQYVTALNSANNLTTSIKILRPGEYAGEYSPRNLAFASIGDGLTDTEAANFYTAVQTFQTTLGRSIGTQTVSDADAQAFVTAANIQDQVEATAVNNLTIGLKADGLWTKMKALYPFVGGSASSHKFNLKNPLDTDAAFRLIFNGGWTHSSTGALPNGLNAYADTKFIPNSNITVSSGHFSVYNRNNDLVGTKIDGVNSGSTWVQMNHSYGDFIFGQIASYASYTPTDTRGLFLLTRTANNSFKIKRNNTNLLTNTGTVTSLPTDSIYIGARNDSGSYNHPNSYQKAFASIGDGLDDTEATNLNSRVTTFQTALSRNV